jgi:hypothetical protein
MVKCMCYMGGFGSNGFVTNVQSFPMDGHYRADIISSVGHSRLNLVMPLVLCTIACNDCDISIVLQVSWVCTNPIENG